LACSGVALSPELRMISASGMAPSSGSSTPPAHGVA
jgi:hypothetical protein